MPKKKKQTASKKEKQTTSKETPKKKAPTKTKEKTPKKFECKLCKNPESLKPIIKIVGTVLIIVASLAFVDLLVQYINNDYSIAVVNGTRVTKNEWHNRLASTYGVGIASQMIEEKIVRLEAKEEGVSVEQEEIDKEIDKIIESIGGEEMFNDALRANNITLKDLRDQIEIDLLATKILTPNLEYEEEDVIDFFNQYSDVIFPDETAELEEGEKLDFDTFREETEEIFIQQEVQMQKGSWLAEKKLQYNIQDNSTDKPAYGFLTITTNIVNNLLEKVGNNNVEDSVEE
ncbi:MAG: SurA N-terminal domain-containing protein [Candidatus Dojkabacteria bacterium]|jgi:foldase protein PrsA